MLSCSFVEALKLQVINSATAAAQLVAYYSFSRSKGWTADLVRADSLALAQAVGVENKFPENVFSWRCRFCSFHTTHSNWKHVRVHLGNQGDAFIFSRPKVLVNVNEMAVRLLKVKGEYKGTREGSSARKKHEVEVVVSKLKKEVGAAVFAAACLATSAIVPTPTAWMKPNSKLYRQGSSKETRQLS
ncbi:hypothetical protein CRG98_016764 [Punica granatum]|uniref:Uncharacterized protein n=1 Tax=Punica granatum TaxID=22663 RepID=A0A2I0K3W4_PUNGR|nr:hypothetical protein CRG98_016764 [Punica granatum]